MKTGVTKISAKVGLPPHGTLIHIGEQKSEKVRISLIEYDEAQFRERELNTLDEFPHREDEFFGSGSVCRNFSRGCHSSFAAEGIIV